MKNILFKILLVSLLLMTISNNTEAYLLGSRIVYVKGDFEEVLNLPRNTEWGTARKCLDDNVLGAPSVVRNIKLWEINARDFGVGLIGCRTMNEKGTLTSTFALSPDLFNHTVSGGSMKRSRIPLDQLPVAIMWRASRGGLVYNRMQDYSIGSLKAALIRRPTVIPDDPYRDTSPVNWSPWATGRTSGVYPNVAKTGILACPAGYVITGLHLRYKPQRRSNEIVQLRMQCTELL